MAAPNFAGIDLNNLDAPVNATTDWGRTGRFRIRNLLDTFTRDADWSAFLLSSPRYEDGNNDDWLPGKPLGAGAFGRVAMWVKKNDLGDAVDHVAIKQCEVHANRPLDGLWHNKLAKEAFIQSQLTTHDQNHCVVALKGYKYYANLQQCRLYMEYAPHQSLITIGMRYWSFDKYLPELWLWCIFEKLVEACNLMRECPGKWHPMDPNAPRDRPNASNFIIHCDIKPQNIFVFDRQPLQDRSKKLPQIPLVKLGDFGLAQVTRRVNHTHPNNEMLSGVGTQAYMPPEVLKVGAPPNDHYFDDNWQNPVYRNISRISERHNVWSVGKVMHDLTFFRHPDECYYQLYDHQREQRYYDNTLPEYEHFTSELFSNPHPGRNIEYSRNLRQLIWDCLRPNRQMRPSSENLLRQIRTCKQICIDDVKQNTTGRVPRDSDKVRLTTAEMNDVDYVAEASFATGADAQGRIADEAWVVWQELRNGDHLDPEEPLFRPPQPKWQPFYDRETLEITQKPATLDLKGQRWKQVGQEVRFRVNVNQLPVAQKDAERKRGLKRMRSWDENVEADLVLRQKLRDLRNRTPYAQDQPLAMFEFVLQNSGLVVSDAEDVLRWLYQTKERDRDWAWLREPHIKRKATRVRQRLEAKGLKRKARECRYFVRHSLAYGVETVDYSVEQMLAVFKK